MSTSAPPAQGTGPAPVPFRALPNGARFVFTSESVPGYGGARGPWRKLSPRRYVRDIPPIDPAHPRLEFVCKVGTVRVECVRID